MTLWLKSRKTHKTQIFHSVLTFPTCTNFFLGTVVFPLCEKPALVSFMCTDVLDSFHVALHCDIEKKLHFRLLADYAFSGHLFSPKGVSIHFFCLQVKKK